MNIRGSTRLLAVLGWPITHSWSPAMHNHVIRKLGLDICYVPLEITPEHLIPVIETLRHANFIGANITIPHKEAVCALVDERSRDSEIMGVVNTIVNHSGRLWGTTTDPMGFLNSLANENVSLQGKNVLILGTGGVARTIAFSLFMAGESISVSMAGRRPQKAEKIALEISRQLKKPLRVLDMNDSCAVSKALQETHLLINATSAGMHPNHSQTPINASLLPKELVVYDTVYNPVRTRLLSEAAHAGCKTISGLGMLACQGCESFKLWTGTNPPLDYFLETLTEADRL